MTGRGHVDGWSWWVVLPAAEAVRRGASGPPLTLCRKRRHPFYRCLIHCLMHRSCLLCAGFGPGPAPSRCCCCCRQLGLMLLHYPRALRQQPLLRDGVAPKRNGGRRLAFARTWRGGRL